MPSIMSFLITVGIIGAFVGFYFGGDYWYVGFVGIGIIATMIAIFIYYLKVEIPKIVDGQFKDMSVRSGMIVLENPNVKPDRRRLYDLD